MRVRTILKASAAAFGLVVAMPAFAQSGGNVNTTDSDHVAVINDLLDVIFTDNAADSYSDDDTKTISKENGSYNGNNAVSANQYLKAVNINRELDEVVDLDGEDDTDTAVGYNSGSNSVNDNAFAAFAGIANAAWNTGINANTQAATNIAAQGTVNFGVGGGGGAGGGDDGGD
ncbi:hypothetical protein FHS95_000684 [Sphingomonas naasensis]|uniref:Curlin n=1 Tax=Sphingomonas naasensis TaxID=1344951 RepID=A0A4S1WS34_9SPHN|nr:hypothetical protein [Sphingomonas naasensis]NIJ19015.1 hypothetical protein [Sphingomonas naasensis]TGX46219.1 hypothetical protein E5A74_03420 [Sphingomonas naasensis]